MADLTTNLEDFIWTGIDQGITHWAAEVQQFESHISGCDAEDPDIAWAFTFEELDAGLDANPEIKERVIEGQFDVTDADTIFQIAAFGGDHLWLSTRHSRSGPRSASRRSTALPTGGASTVTPASASATAS